MNRHRIYWPRFPVSNLAVFATAAVISPRPLRIPPLHEIGLRLKLGANGLLQLRRVLRTSRVLFHHLENGNFLEPCGYYLNNALYRLEKLQARKIEYPEETPLRTIWNDLFNMLRDECDRGFADP